MPEITGGIGFDLGAKGEAYSQAKLPSIKRRALLELDTKGPAPRHLQAADCENTGPIRRREHVGGYRRFAEFAGQASAVTRPYEAQRREIFATLNLMALLA